MTARCATSGSRTSPRTDSSRLQDPLGDAPEHRDLVHEIEEARTEIGART